MSFNKFLQVSIFVLFCVIFPVKVGAAILYLEPQTGEYGVGETFILEARIDLESGENINVVEANLKYPSDLLEFVDLSFGNSLLTVMVEKPKFSVVSCEIYGLCGLVSFAGGIPGGYTGRIPGDPGLSNLLAKIIFRGVSRDVSRGFAEVIFQDDSQVLLNDGFGTPTKLTTKGATIEVRPPEEVGLPKNEWQEELEKDKISPEPFEIKILQDPSIFEGKYFIVFSTTDKQTGLDYYEVAEQRGTRRGITLNWKKAESPYLLEDQSLKSYIYVKAVDKAANERIETLSLQAKKTSQFYLVVMLVGSLIVFFALYFLAKRFFIIQK